VDEREHDERDAGRDERGLAEAADDERERQAST
jgi:hypothetical protein